MFFEKIICLRQNAGHVVQAFECAYSFQDETFQEISDALVIII